MASESFDWSQPIGSITTRELYSENTRLFLRAVALLDPSSSFVNFLGEMENNQQPDEMHWNPDDKVDQECLSFLEFLKNE